MHCDRVSLFMIDPSTNELWFKVSKDASAAGFRFPIGKGTPLNLNTGRANGTSNGILQALLDLWHRPARVSTSSMPIRMTGSAPSWIARAITRRGPSCAFPYVPIVALA